MKLHGQRVVVLGGTSGIGLATAGAVAAQGAEVTVVSSRKTSVERALATLPPGSRGRVADLTDAPSVEALFDDLGDFDHLVFTAGEPPRFAPLEGLDPDAAKGLFSLRFFGALSAVRAAWPHLRAGGSITLTTGTAKDRPAPGWTVAAGVSGAVDALTRALAVELAPLRVNAVSAGVVRTPMWSAALSDADRERLYASAAATNPTGRVGEAADLAQAYLFLLTQPFATGTVLTVDGGMVLV